MTVYYYPNCSTCKKAIKWLKDNGVDVTLKHIVDETPDYKTMEQVLSRSGLSIQKLFNTSGKLYREMHIKEALKTMDTTEALTLLSQNGMLIKRPILLSETFSLVGFKEEEWKAALIK